MLSEDKLQKYFFNNQYNEKIINKHFNSLRESSYKRAIRLQNHVHGAHLITGTMSDFSVDPMLNKQYKLPVGSFTARISEHIIPYYNEKIFNDKYGRNKVISLMDIMADPVIFSRYLIFKIDIYNFFLLNIIMTESGCLLIIKPDITNGLTPASVNGFIQNNVQWSLHITNQTDYMSTYRIKTALFNGTQIPFTNFDTKKYYNKPYKLNSWNMYMTVNSAEPNLLISSSCNAVKNADTTEAFQLSQVFKDYVFTRTTNCKCIVINSYQKTGFCKFLANIQGFVPIIQIPFDVNPVAKENIVVWEYDALSDTKGKRVTGDIVVTYPNIYDFRALYGTKDLYIEWYNSPLTQATFDNNFKNYMACYPSTFLSAIVNKTAPASILNYSPMNETVYDYDDYKASSYFGDIRGYKLSKMIALLKENPLRYSKFMKEINVTNCKSINGIYKKATNPVVFSTSIFNNLGQAKVHENYITFSEAQTYITMTNSTNQNRFVGVYVNGLRIPVTHIFTEENKSYIYFAKKYITDTSVITVDASMSIKNKRADAPFIIYDSEFGAGLPIPELFGDVSIDDLLFYYTETKFYIPLSELIIRMKLNEYVINKISGNSETIVDIPTTDPSLFATSLSEIYKPTDVAAIELVAGEILVNSPTGGFRKKINSGLLNITSTLIENLNTSISATNTDFYRSVSVPDISLTPTLTMDNFVGEPNADRIRVYVGGVLLRESQYTVTLPTKYGDSLTVNVTNYPVTANLSTFMEYLPYKKNKIYDGIPSSSDIYINGTIFLNSPIHAPEDYEIYIDGVRVSQQQIKQLQVNNAMVITGYNTGSVLTIYLPYNDADCYEFSTATCVISNIAKTDTVFLEYLKSL